MMSNLEKIVIDWMSNKGAPEWHGVAVNWNWDCGLEPLLWIVNQPDCDEATALTVFWMSEPFYQIDERYREYPKDETYTLVHRILDNWNRYRTARFCFRLPDYVQYLHSEKWGLSKECLEVLQPLLINTDGNERYPNYGQAGPAECYVAYLELIGEPVTDLEHQALERERTGNNLSKTAEEIAASHQREWEKWISEWDDILSTCEKYALKKE